jgi:aromatic ring hydroxylase
MKNSLKTTITALSALLLCTISARAENNTSPIIADLDGNGRISRTEAENMMNSPGLKSELFNATTEEQGRFYNALENSIRVRLLKLSRAYGTPRWSMAIEMCERNGLSAQDAERIALAMRANASNTSRGSKAKSVTDGTPIIADLDGDGRISRIEAENMMNSPSLKSELFNASADDQSRFYNALENNIRVRLLKLSRAYGTPRWSLAIEMCERNGLSAQDAERIAIAMQIK